MGTDHEYSVACPECKTPVRIHCPEIDLIRFPADDDRILQLLSGELHVHECPACQTKTPIFVPVMITHNAMDRVLVAVPKTVAEETRQMLVAVVAQIGADVKVTICENYVELYSALASWINEILMPFLEVMLARSGGEPNVDPDDITPLILKLFHGQAVGAISPFLRMERDGSPIDGRDLMRQLHAGLVIDLLADLRRKAVRTRTLSELEDSIRARVPQECIVDEVLEHSLSLCPTEFVDPIERPADFSQWFVCEYGNAVLHAVCERDNPRAGHWASCLRLVWWLRRRSDTTLDQQFQLPASVIRRTVKFSDLWDVYGKDPTDDLDALRTHMSDRHEMLDAYGFADDEMHALQSGMIRMRVSADAPEGVDALMGDLGRTFLAKLVEQFPLNVSEEQSAAFGTATGYQIRTLAKNGQVEVGKRVAQEALERAITARDSTAAFSAATSSIEALNLFGEHAAAAEFARRVLTDLDNLAECAPNLATLWRQMLGFFNENGNVFRYMQHYEESLGSYQVCETLIDRIPDEGERPRLWAILRKNQAIVYREMGCYGKARSLFDGLIGTMPDDASLRNSAAALEYETGDYGRARHHIDHALHVTEGRVLPEDRATLFLTRGVIRFAQHDVTGATEDLAQAFAGSKHGSEPIALRAACALVRCAPVADSPPQLVEACATWLEDKLLQGDDGDISTLAGLTRELTRTCLIVTVLAEHYLNTDCPVEAESRLHRKMAWLDRHSQHMPWEYHVVRSRMHYELERFDPAARHLVAAIASVSADVPMGEDGTFALGWMRNKRELQYILGHLGAGLADRGVLRGGHLLDIYEFLNGREIGGRLKRELDPSPIAEHLAVRFRELKRECVVFWFLEVDDRVRLGCSSSSHFGTWFVEGCDFARSEIESAKQRLRNVLNVMEPESLMQDVEGLCGWDELAARVGHAISPFLLPGCVVCFLPGRAFTGLPLHLVTLPDGRVLIEEHPVACTANFATLLAELGTNAHRRASAAVVTVTRLEEREEFRRQAKRAAQELVELLGGTDRVTCLSGEAADHDAVLSACSQVSEVVFLCHGANAGPGKGAGICISDRGELPPSLFPIKQVPELKRFVICWDDFEGLRAAPALVMSIACSSGLADVGQSGERFGLEQALFAKGTQAIVSPLWDVDQGMAVNWMKAFVRTSRANPDATYLDAHRAASLEMREGCLGLHPTAWGAFTFNGSIIG